MYVGGVIIPSASALYDMLKRTGYLSHPWPDMEEYHKLSNQIPFKDVSPISLRRCQQIHNTRGEKAARDRHEFFESKMMPKLTGLPDFQVLLLARYRTSEPWTIADLERSMGKYINAKEGKSVWRSTSKGVSIGYERILSIVRRI